MIIDRIEAEGSYLQKKRLLWSVWPLWFLWISVFLLVSHLLCLPVYAGDAIDAIDETDETIWIQVDGEQADLLTAPIMVEGRVLVPLRAIVELLDGSVQWYPDEQQIIGFRGGRGFDVVLGASWAYLSDGSVCKLDVPAQIISGRSYVPLRFVSEALGCEVQWESSQRTVSIHTSPINQRLEVEALARPVLLQVITDSREGSGFFYSKDGQVITCAELIKGATWIKVRTVDGSEYEVEIQIIDRLYNLAKLRVKREAGEVFPVFRYFDDGSGIEEGEAVYVPYAGYLPYTAATNPVQEQSQVQTQEQLLEQMRRQEPSPIQITMLHRQIKAKNMEQEDRGGICTYDLNTPLSVEQCGGPLVKENGSLLGVNCFLDLEGRADTYVVPIEYLFTMRNR